MSKKSLVRRFIASITPLACAECHLITPYKQFAHTCREEKFTNAKGNRVNLSDLPTIDHVIAELPKGRFLCHYCHCIETKQENDAIRASFPLEERTSNARRKRRFRDSLQVLIDNDKLAKKCCRECGQVVLPELCSYHDHHHPPGVEKLGNISEIENKRLLRAEMAKCEILCKVCHFIETHGERWYHFYPDGSVSLIFTRFSGGRSIKEEVRVDPSASRTRFSHAFTI